MTRTPYESTVMGPRPRGAIWPSADEELSSGVLADVPMPPAVAARPRDARGYPVPAITPWVDGQPRFGVTSVERTFLCAIERRCSICAITIPPGPVWRVVGPAEAQAMAAALAGGRAFHNDAPTAEAPGHRLCMLYAAMVCPWLSQPTARRGTPGAAPGIEVAKGARRGSGGAVAGFQSYDFSFTETDGVVFRFAGLVDFRPHERGSEHLPALRAAPDGLPRGDAAPAYLLADEAAAVRAFAAVRDALLG